MKTPILVDENLSWRLADVLSWCFREVMAETVRDRFSSGVVDTEWIAEAANMHPRPILLTGDTNILRKEEEASVFWDSGLSAIYVMIPEKMPFYEQFWRLLRAWPSLFGEIQSANKRVVLKYNVGSDRKPILKKD